MDRITAEVRGQLKLIPDPPWLDTEKSFARIDITPEKHGDESWFRYSASLEIKPYPNPVMFGGMWQSGAATSEEELEKVIDDFRKAAEEFVELGMKELEIVRHEE